MMEVAPAPIGLVVEGDSEWYAVPRLLRSLRVRHTTPAKCGGFGHTMRPEAIAKRALPHLRAQAKKRVRRLLFVLDRETRDDCPVSFSQDVRSAIREHAGGRWADINKLLIVVCCDRTVENWLIADPDGLARHAFIRRDRIRGVGPQVDGIDAVSVLKKAFVRGQFYTKGAMTGDLAARVRVREQHVQTRSRSLRKFVKECGRP